MYYRIRTVLLLLPSAYAFVYATYMYMCATSIHIVHDILLLLLLEAIFNICRDYIGQTNWFLIKLGYTVNGVNKKKKKNSIIIVLSMVHIIRALYSVILLFYVFDWLGLFLKRIRFEFEDVV